ncbi:MAG TPA: sigma-70 family RNA polymerase sigma factor [Polyangiaceae bacterium]|nr:sigma-70 family RNA polymerase sigma factor [Polyangiaceae bacterium]
MAVDGEGDLGAMFEEGRRAWPALSVDRARFEEYVAERAPSPAERSSLSAADLYLVCACAGKDPRAIAEFEGRYVVDVPRFLARQNPTPSFVDEVRQRVRERLFVEGKINQYSGRGSLGSWLRVVTVRVASNVRRQSPAHADIDEVVIGTAIDPELDVIRERYGKAYRVALRDALAGLEVEDRNLVRLHYLDGLNLEGIAEVLHVSRATIGRRVVAVRRLILEETNRLLRERLRATPAELESLLKLVRSRLGVSLGEALRD